MNNQFNFPVYRIGRICSIDEEISKQETIRLSDYIESEWKTYYSRFLNKFDSLGVKNIRKSKEEIRKEEEETIILSFPKLTFDVGGYHVKSRNSIAICSANHNSKIWTKLTCLKQNGKLAYDLSPREVRKFYNLAKEQGLGIIDIIFPEYEEATKKIKKIKALHKDYILEIMATNSNDETVRTILDGLKDILIEDMNELVDNKKYLRVIADYFYLAFDKKMSLSDYKSFVNNNKLKWIGCETDDYNSIFYLIAEDLFTRLSGISFNQNKDYSKMLPSEDASKEVLRRFAGIF